MVSQLARVRFSNIPFFLNERLHISENSHLLLKYTPLDAVSTCVVKMFYFKK